MEFTKLGIMSNNDLGYTQKTNKPSHTGLKVHRDKMSLFEINESCDRLSKPESETGYTIKDHSTYDCKEGKDGHTHEHVHHFERFEGKKKMKTKEMNSLVDRLYNSSSKNEVKKPSSESTKTVSGAHSSHHRTHHTQYTKNSYSDLKDNVYKVMSGHY